MNGSRRNPFCRPIRVSGVRPGWGCCKCATYNLDISGKCAHCSHDRCDGKKPKSN